MKNYIIAAGLFLLGADYAEARKALSPYLWIDGRVIKWGEPVSGTPATITYTYLTQPYEFEGGISPDNCRRTEPLAQVLAAAGVTLEVFHAETRKALSAWERIAGVTYRYVDSVEEADVLLGSMEHLVADYAAFTNLRVTSSITGETNTITKGIICLNILTRWSVDATEDKHIAVFQMTNIHEFGHIGGLGDQSGFTSAVMAKDLRVRSFVSSDIESMHYLYGPPH